eukprot:gene19447-25328_t
MSGYQNDSRYCKDNAVPITSNDGANLCSVESFISLYALLSESGNPFVVTPSTTADTIRKSCSFSILSASCSSYNEVTSQSLEIPEECSDSLWSKAILTFTAQEQGVQYDRVGAIWIGDIEIVRTTTPEPTDL